MKIIGHRGARGLAPENTAASFEAALKCNVDAIELDVHLTKDGVLVCCHDPVFVFDGKPYPVAEYTYNDLQKHKPDLTTLPEAITVVNRSVPIVVEVKETTPAEPVISCIREFLDRGWHMDDFEFCSFAQQPLVALRAAFPQAELIPNETWSSIKACWRARQLHSRRISMKEKWLWRGYLRGMQRSGWKVSSYTINDPARARKWAPYLYALYTDYPDRITSK